MSGRVTAFEFAAAPDFAGASVCNINHTSRTVQYPGVAGLAFELIPIVGEAVNDLAGQDVADGDAETERTIYNDDNTVALVVKATVAGGAVTGVSPGAVSFPPAKATALFDVLDDLEVSGLLG